MAQVASIEALVVGAQLSQEKLGATTAWIAHGKLQFGVYPEVMCAFDFESEAIPNGALPKLSTSTSRSSYAPEVNAPVAVRQSRSTGNFKASMGGTEVTGKNLIELLANGLRLAEQHRQGSLKELEAHKPRSKRVVARDRTKLYENRPDLQSKCSEEILPGWFMATNNSQAEVFRYLDLAAEISGLGRVAG